MGLLSDGTPLSWEETKAYADHVRAHGAAQFLNLYRRVKDRTRDHLKFGDEVEYTLLRFDHEEKKVQVLLKAHEILPRLQLEEEKNPSAVKSLWRPEYADYMVEGTPGQPYGYLIDYINTIEANMALRRKAVMQFLGENEAILSLTAFPRLGCPQFSYPVGEPDPVNGVSRSLFFPDSSIFPNHPRYRTLTRNIRERRGEKVAINLPIFKDKNTSSPYVEDVSADPTGESALAALPDHVYADAMGFGMGLCCLQMTFQACNISEARALYDELTPICPVLVALSAAMPILRGRLLDIDHRWSVIVNAVDDRNKEERGLEPLKERRFVIPKSRYDTIDSYLSEVSASCNDIEIVKDEVIYEQLIDNGIDPLLAQHIAHLFIRDPVSLFSEKIHQDDENESDHFENLQSTNWQSMRFKPPPPNSEIGWRVECRPMDLQITDFENAAFITFVVLLTRVIASFRLNLVIPISKVDESFRRAQKRDAVLTEKLFFRHGDCVTTCSSPPEASEVLERRRTASTSSGPDFNEARSSHPPEQCYKEFTVQEIVSGCDDFPGLIPLIRQYLFTIEADINTVCTISQYLSLIEDRASGKLRTEASWIRHFVTTHKDYKHDSVVSESINYDLLMAMSQITGGELTPQDLLPSKYLSRSDMQLPQATLAGEQHLNQKRKMAGPEKQK